MKFSLVNPNWSFDGSIYFGCREPHLPLEYGYARQLLEEEGHEAVIVDGQLENLSDGEIRRRVADFAPDFTVVTTAPSYLFWRCAPPELRVPVRVMRELRDVSRALAVVGPHASTTPKAALKKTGADVAVLGECEEILVRLARSESLESLPAVCFRHKGDIRVNGGPHASDMAKLPALIWPEGYVSLHRHHHHRFDSPGAGPGAEVEFSRGCPYHCTFCAKDNFRNAFRKRPLEAVLREIDGLLEQGVEYLYFIDEIFMPHRDLLQALAERPLKFGVQMRIDLWNHEMLEMLGCAGCVSIEAGVESISPEGRDALAKKCRITTDDLVDRLIHAKQWIPFVQANLLESSHDDPESVQSWRVKLQDNGVWANRPVPLFPYPGSPEYTLKWGLPDDLAWERAHAHYLEEFDRFSDIQDDRPVPLAQLEMAL